MFSFRNDGFILADYVAEYKGQLYCFYKYTKVDENEKWGLILKNIKAVKAKMRKNNGLN